MNGTYQLFSWNYSYFSAKVRAYMNYKRHEAGLRFEDILATQEIIRDLLVPATGSNVVPQVRTPAGTWLQDSSEIIDALERAVPAAPVIPQTPTQKLVGYLIELLADEWMLPWGFWERWHYSLAAVEPNHETFNALQWGRIFNATGTGRERIEAARFVFRELMRIDAPEQATFGPYAGLVQLGITPETIPAWTASMHGMLAILEAHFDQHDYILGGMPSLPDFALVGPLYPHLYKDPVPGFMMRTQYPLVSEWIERVNGSPEPGYGSYVEPRYALLEGELVPQPRGSLLSGDLVPPSIKPLIALFFDEMWPMLKATVDAVRRYVTANGLKEGHPLPGKSFYSPAEFRDLQSGAGPLTLRFELRGTSVQRMASPYHVWMLQRMSDAVIESTSADALDGFLRDVHPCGTELIKLPELLADCPIHKAFEVLSVGSARSR